MGLRKRFVRFGLLWAGLSVSFAGTVDAQEARPAARIERMMLLDSVPSGSGLAAAGDSMYIAGDDAGHIYKLDPHSGGYRRIPLTGRGGLFRVPRGRKPDYEAAVTATVADRDCLLLFGSGSLSPYRDSLLIMPINEEGIQKHRDLQPLYEQLQAAARLKHSQWNIEAAAASGERLYLFNRASNHVFSIPYKTFAEAPGAAVPAAGIEVAHLDLPVLQGVRAGFSGACTLDDSTFLFCASLEATQHTTEDGAILGSYVGLLRHTGPGVFSIPLLLPVIAADGSPYLGKLESVLPLSREKDLLEVAGVADNDDGHSQLIFLRVKLPG